MTLTTDKAAPAGRNFLVWGAVGGIFYILALWLASLLLHQDILGAMSRPTKAVGLLALGLIFTVAMAGFINRKRRVDGRNFRNVLIHNMFAPLALLLVIWGFSALARTGGAGGSEWAAAAVGATLIILAAIGLLTVASAHAGAGLIDDEESAEEMRERSHLYLYSFAWMAVCGLLLIGLGLAGPTGMLAPAPALAGALVLILILVALGIATWRLSDELGRTLSHETGNMAFYLIVLVGGGWAMLAHLGFVDAPVPLDWLTLFTVLLFGSSFIVAGRRKMLKV